MSRGFFPHIISNNHSVNRLSNNTEYFLFPNSFVLLVIIPYSDYVWKVESFSVMRTHCGFSFRAGINSSAERERDCAAADQADDDGGDDGNCPCSTKLHACS